MKTLEQLKKQVAVPKEGQEVPSEKTLRENEEVYESICIGHDARITVYRNGYVVCMIGRHKTVFPISAAGYYTFGENEKDFLERDFRRHQETGTGDPGGSTERRLSLDQEEWQLALYIAGEDRILKNMDAGIRKKTLHTKREKETGADEVFERSWVFRPDRKRKKGRVGLLHPPEDRNRGGKRNGVFKINGFEDAYTGEGKDQEIRCPEARPRKASP